jgi:hypothetical protein
LAADLGDEATRVRNLPALGFLGLGPWFYDNGSVEITRADERHDRVDAVSRGFLGLTVACARCHDHKYDPIPQRDYYALAGVFLNTQYTEYPLAPKAVVDEYKDLEKKMTEKRKSEKDWALEKKIAACFQVEALLAVGLKVQGETKKERVEVVEATTDYEPFDRWLRFAKAACLHPDLKPWQEMIKSGGTAGRQTASDEFQEKVIDLMRPKKAIDEENDITAPRRSPARRRKNLRCRTSSSRTTLPAAGCRRRACRGTRHLRRHLQRDLDSQLAADRQRPVTAAHLRRLGLER